MNISCKKLNLKYLINYQKENQSGIQLLEGQEKEFLTRVLLDGKFYQGDVSIMSYLPKKRKNKKIVFYNFNYIKEIKNMYKIMVWPHLKWLIPAILATALGIWLKWDILIIAGAIAIMHRVYRYLNVFSFVSKKIQFLDKKVLDDNLLAEGEKIVFDDIKFISTPQMEIVFFTRKGLIPPEGFIFWDDSSDRQELINLFENYCKELNLTIHQVAYPSSL